MYIRIASSVVHLLVAVNNMQKRVRESGERGRGDDKLQATISLSVKRLENYMRVSKNNQALKYKTLGFVTKLEQSHTCKAHDVYTYMYIHTYIV